MEHKVAVLNVVDKTSEVSFWRRQCPERSGIYSEWMYALTTRLNNHGCRVYNTCNSMYSCIVNRIVSVELLCSKVAFVMSPECISGTRLGQFDHQYCGGGKNCGNGLTLGERRLDTPSLHTMMSYDPECCGWCTYSKHVCVLKCMHVCAYVCVHTQNGI